MTLEPIHHDLTHAQPDVVLALRQALAQADEQVTALAEAGEWEALAYGLHALLPLKRDISDLARRAEDALAASMPAKEVRDLPGLPPFERRKGSDRKAWQSADLLREIVHQHRHVNPETGEITVDTDALLDALKAAVPFTGSLGWRVKALRELGLDPDEWCETKPGRVAIQWHEGTDR